MPTYAYRCSQCGHEFEEYQQMTADPLIRCPSCGGDTLARVMGTGSGVIFKGSGFYKTDYKKESSSKTPDKTNESKKDEKKIPPGGADTKGTTEAPKKE